MKRAKTGDGDASRLGCKYADQYYAGMLGIPETEAKKIYSCSIDREIKGIPECPFGFLPDCLKEIDMSENWKQGVIIGLLNERGSTCSLVPFALMPNLNDKIGYECSHCKATVIGDPTFMRFCYHCGARVE